MNPKISIDSNSHTYLVEAVSPDYQPEIDNSGLAEERKAMLRIFLYVQHPYYVLPTVKKEFMLIKNEHWRNEHEEFTKFLLRDYFGRFNSDEILKRKQFLLIHHNKEIDCQILAEAEAARMNILLTCDKRLIKRLGSIAKGVRITKPTEYLEGLNILPGTKPIWRPKSSNPLSKKTWWKI